MRLPRATSVFPASWESRAEATGPAWGRPGLGRPGPFSPREPISVKRSSLSEYRNAGDIFNRELSRSSRPSPLH